MPDDGVHDAQRTVLLAEHHRKEGIMRESAKKKSRNLVSGSVQPSRLVAGCKPRTPPLKIALRFSSILSIRKRFAKANLFFSCPMTFSIGGVAPKSPV